MTTTASAELTAGRWSVDLARSTATFRVANLGRTVTGTVPITAGALDVDAAGNPTAITGTLDLAAIHTGNKRRDKDLRKPSLLDLDQHPTMTFVADTITVSPEGWAVTGWLTARGVTVLLRGTAELSTEDGSVALTAHTRLDRRSFGVRAPRFLIGHGVDITVTATIHR
jgi:polyisoprenoid-binding protein YceI